MLAIAAYQWYLFFHILAAAAWVGGGLALAALAIAARKQDDPAQELALVRLGGKIGGPFFGVSGLVLLGFGFALVAEGDWDWGEAFVIWGFAAWAFSLLTGIFYYGMEQRGLDAAAERGDDAEVRRRLNRYYMVGRIDSLVLVSAVFAMSAKPFL